MAELMKTAIESLAKALESVAVSGHKRVLRNENVYVYNADSNGNIVKRTQLRTGLLADGSYGKQIIRETGLTPLTETKDGVVTTLALGFRWVNDVYADDKKTIIGETMTSTWELKKSDAEILCKAYEGKLIDTPMAIDEIHANNKDCVPHGLCIVRVGPDIRFLTGSGEQRSAEKEARKKTLASTSASITEQFQAMHSRQDAKSYDELESESAHG